MKRKILDLDAQIAALERGEGASDESPSERSSSDNDSDSDSDSDSDDVSVSKKKPSSSSVVETLDESGAVTILKSIISEEAPIAPLSAQHLPAANCGNTTKKQEPKKKKLKKIPPTAAEAERSGLEKTVNEMLRNYQPSSSEKRPFWCRICRFQGTSADDLMAHRESEFHVVASQKERKLSYCKLCKVQFTSPDQLKEHLRGSKHKAKLDYAVQNQRSAKNSRGQKYERI